MKTSITIILSALCLVAHAQNWTLVKKVVPEQEITAVSIDSKNLFYVGTSRGNVIRYEATGEEDEYFSALNNSSVTMIQAWNRLKIFSFHRDQQSVAIFDRFTTIPKIISLTELNQQYAWLFTPGIDRSYWALSTEFRELIKYDDPNMNVLFRVVLDKNIKLKSACSLRAFKNLLMIVDSESGIWVFDQYGKLQGQIQASGIRHIQIKDNLIHTTNGSEYLIIDPFQLEIVQKTKAPDGAFWSVVTTGDRFIFFSDSAASIYQLN